MKLKNAPGFIPEKYKSTSVCESCGDEFACGAALEDCWCMDVKVSAGTREKLKSNYKYCLCRNCLEKFDSAEE